MDWIAALKSNPNEAVTMLYDEYRSEAINWMVRENNINRDEADEIFQTALVLLYENFVTGKLVNLTSGIKTYLFGIIKNKIIHYQRLKSKLSPVDASELLKESILDEYTEVEEIDLNISAAAMEQLGDPCKSILQLSFFQQKGIEEITKLMEYKNSDTTKNLKYKCLKRLQKLFFELKYKK